VCSTPPRNILKKDMLKKDEIKKKKKDEVSTIAFKMCRLLYFKDQ
jgi:hypothetical protein